MNTDTHRVPVVVCGAAGRMGREIVRLLAAHENAFLRGAVEVEGHPCLGQDAGIVSGCGALGVSITSHLASLLTPEIIVLDFTNPSASLEHARLVAAHQAGIVVGTTGFSPSERAELDRLLVGIRAIVAPNMSVGVTVLVELVRLASQALGDSFDIEVIEIHHRGKKDAPSGTALALAHAASSPDRERTLCYGRHGIAPRSTNEIGVFAVRGGDVVGDHIVLFAGLGERLELTHRAQSRESLARGAVRAAVWLSTQPPGRYSMRDVLGLRF